MAKPKFHAGVFRRGCCILPGRLLGSAGETAAGPALPAPVPAPRLEPSPAEGPGSPRAAGFAEAGGGRGEREGSSAGTAARREAAFALEPPVPTEHAADDNLRRIRAV